MSEWETRLLRSALQGGLVGLGNALSDKGCFVLFSRNAGEFNIQAKGGFSIGNHVYEFLEEQPWLLEDCFVNGFAALGESECYLKDTQLFAATDSIKSPSLLLLFESGVSHSEAKVVHSILSALPSRGCKNISQEKEGDDWINGYVEALENSSAPCLLQAEPGTDLRSIAETYCNQHLAESFVFFEPGYLTEDVHLREVFGDSLGARLSGGVGVIPLVERGRRAIVINEPGLLSRQVQLRMIARFSENNDSIFWCFCSTMDLQKMTQAGRFELSLANLLKKNTIEVAPLRTNVATIRLEVGQLLSEVRSKHGRIVSLTEEAWQVVESYGWPGNHEELRSVMIEAILLARNGTIDSADIRFDRNGHVLLNGDLSLRSQLASAEKKLILQSYVIHSGNQVHMAKALGISRGSLQYKLEKFGYMDATDV